MSGRHKAPKHPETVDQRAAEAAKLANEGRRAPDDLWIQAVAETARDSIDKTLLIARRENP